MKKQKIIWLHSHTLLSTGGTRFIHEVLLRLSKIYDVELIVEKTSEEWRNNFQQNNVGVSEIGSLSSNSLIYWIFFPILFFYDLHKIKKLVHKNDIVISSMFPMNAVASLVSSKNIYYCFEPFAFFYDKQLMMQDGKIKFYLLTLLSSLYSWLDKFGTKKSKIVLAINQSVGKHIKNIYNIRPGGYTYLGVDFKHFKKNKAKKKNSKTIFFHSTDYTVLKGTQYLFPALKILKKYKNDFQIIISDSVVKNSVKESLISKITELKMKNIIVFKNHIPYKDLPKYYSISDAYLFLGDPGSTGATAASLSVLEAQACGLPVIRSIGNNNEIIEGKTGFFVDPRNPKDLAMKLIHVIENKKSVSKMSSKCIKHVKDKYTWENVAEKIIKSIESFN